MLHRMLFGTFVAFIVGTNTFATQSEPKEIRRIALLGCIRQNEAVPALDKYAQLNADLHLWVGDNVYADAEEDPELIRQSYRTLADHPDFAEVRQQGEHMMTWDDHDYGLNDAGRNYKLKVESQQAFIQFWDLEDRIPRDQQGVYSARIFGPEGRRLQVLMLDVRYHRDDPGLESDVLGDAQWSWLERELRKPADLRLIVSGIQVLLPEEAGSETWDQFPAARDRLVRTVRESGAQRVVFVTGDQHYGEVGRLRNGLDFDLVELQFAGLNQIESPEFNPYRVSTVCTSKHSYAYIDVNWEQTQEELPHLLFKVCSADTNAIEVLYRLNFSEIEFQIEFSKPVEFVDSMAVTLDHDYPRLNLLYTTDPTVAPNRWNKYSGSFDVKQTTQVRTVLATPNGSLRSPIYTQTYTRLVPIEAVAIDRSKEGLRFAYYEGEFQDQPNFRELQPKQTGIARTIDIEAIAERADHFGIVYEGYVAVPEDGLYEFALRSDDGSLLWLHDQCVVDNQGSHAARTATGRMALKAGAHPLRLEYFEDYLGQELQLSIQRIDPEGDQTIPLELLHSANGS